VFTDSSAFQIKIPVRIFKHGGFVKDLVKGDFQITINNLAKEITDCKLVKTNFRDSDKPRDIVLKFTTTYLGDDYKKTLNFIIKDVIRNGDRLFVWSPTNRISEIKLNNGRLQSSSEIFDLLKKDTLSYLAQRKITERQVVGHLFGAASDPGEEMRVLNNCLSSWRLYKSKHLLPNYSNYSNLSKILKSSNRRGFIIDFHQKNIAPIVVKIRKRIKSTRSKYSGTNVTGGSAVVSAARMLENSLQLKDEFPSTRIINALLGGGLSYHVVLYNNLRSETSANSQIPDLQNILTTISKSSGGIAVDTNDFMAGVKQILDYKDYCYYLSVKFNGAVEDKVINIKLNDVKGEMLYLNLIQEKEVANLKTLMEMPQVEIKGFKCIKRSLSFAIKNYALNAAQKNGLVGVRIIIRDASGKVVFNTGKKLKTKKEVITIRGIRLPDRLKGEMNLKMIVVDLLSGKQAEVNSKVKL
jgi:hypothetical protein